MMRAVLLLASLVALMAGCSAGGVVIRLATENEIIPNPTFTLTGRDAASQPPAYSRVKLYDISDGCAVPDCPIVWDLIVPDKRGREKLVYGAMPGVGAYTVTSAKRLMENHRYEMVVSGNENQPGGFESRERFEVTDDGHVVPAVQ